MKKQNEKSDGSISNSCYTIMREYGKTPNGNDLNGRWVLRVDGVLVDFDQYRNDLIERNELGHLRCS